MKIGTIAGVSLVVIGCLAGWIASSPYSEGTRVGTILKFAHKGFICKTWEGETAMGTTTMVGSGAYQTWPFSVRDPQVIKQLEDSQSTGKPVKLHYAQYKFRLPIISDSYVPCRTDSEYVVNGVETIQ